MKVSGALGANPISRPPIDEGEILDELPPQERKSKYPWPAWTDGRARKIWQGRHFTSSAAGMRTTLVAHGRRRDIAVRVFGNSSATTEDERGRVLYFQFFPGRRFKDGPPPSLG